MAVPVLLPYERTSRDRPGDTHKNGTDTAFVWNSVIAADIPADTGYTVIPMVLGYGLLDEIPHFATVSYAFCKRFPEELTEEIFEHILNKALNNRMVDPGIIFIDGTHIKTSANKKKFQKEKVAKAAKVYAEQLREEVNEERRKLGKKEIEDDDEDKPQGGGTVEKTGSTTGPDSGMFIKGEHERQFAYEAHMACDRKSFVLGVEVTAGNIHDSIAWDALYSQVTERFPQAEFITMDAGYKTPWIAKKTLDNGRIPILPYTNRHYKQEYYKPWKYEYDPKTDSFTCPHGGTLRHTTTDKEGKRTYRYFYAEARFPLLENQASLTDCRSPFK